jgi:tetratricopeptide (TPR) repeat protein
LWLRISERYVMQAISQPLARYRSYTGSMSTNAARMHNNRLAVLTKYFGPPTDNPQTWIMDKRRAYAFAYRSTCIGYLQQGQADEAWQYLAQGVAFWPDLLKRLDTWYELACGDKPWGQRDQLNAQQLQETRTELIQRIELLFGSADVPVQAFRRVAVGNSYWVLGMLADQNGERLLAKTYLLKALTANKRLGLHYPFVRRLLKVSAGPRLVSIVRKTREVD